MQTPVKHLLMPQTGGVGGVMDRGYLLAESRRGADRATLQR
jgi:hypothetical protein